MKQPTKYFFITGYPRSRTAWLANLFTVWPRSICLHDELEIIKAGGIARGEEQQPEFQGLADVGIAREWPWLVDTFPTAKWMVVSREPEAASRSTWNWTRQPEWYPHLARPKYDDVMTFMHQWGQCLAHLMTALPEERLRVVPFADLDREQTVRELWNFVYDGAAGLEWSAARFAMLNRLRVETIPSKYPCAGLMAADPCATLAATAATEKKQSNKGGLAWA